MLALGHWCTPCCRRPPSSLCFEQVAACSLQLRPTSGVRRGLPGCPTLLIHFGFKIKYRCRSAEVLAPKHGGNFRCGFGRTPLSLWGGREWITWKKKKNVAGWLFFGSNLDPRGGSASTEVALLVRVRALVQSAEKAREVLGCKRCARGAQKGPGRTRQLISDGQQPEQLGHNN